MRNHLQATVIGIVAAVALLAIPALGSQTTLSLKAVERQPEQVVYISEDLPDGANHEVTRIQILLEAVEACKGQQYELAVAPWGDRTAQGGIEAAFEVSQAGPQYVLLSLESAVESEPGPTSWSVQLNGPAPLPVARRLELSNDDPGAPRAETPLAENGGSGRVEVVFAPPAKTVVAERRPMVRQITVPTVVARRVRVMPGPRVRVRRAPLPPRVVQPHRVRPLRPRGVKPVKPSAVGRRPGQPPPAAKPKRRR